MCACMHVYMAIDEHNIKNIAEVYAFKFNKPIQSLVNIGLETANWSPITTHSHDSSYMYIPSMLEMHYTGFVQLLAMGYVVVSVNWYSDTNNLVNH